MSNDQRFPDFPYGLSGTRITADLSLGNFTGTDLDNARGVGLGFYNFTTDPGFQEVGWGFTGLVLAPDGDLYAYRNTAAWWGQQHLSAEIPFVGQFDPTASYTLFYDVDFSDGTISNISLTGSTADYSQLAMDTSGWFNDGATKMAAFIGSSSAWGSVGYVDNFSVMFIPEPGSWMLLLSAASLGLLWRRRK